MIKKEPRIRRRTKRVIKYFPFFGRLQDLSSNYIFLFVDSRKKENLFRKRF